jgi:hypothetical protein
MLDQLTLPPRNGNMRPREAKKEDMLERGIARADVKAKKSQRRG